MTSTVEILGHPFSDTVTVYVPAVTDIVLVVSFVFHKNSLPPVAVNSVLPPEQKLKFPEICAVELDKSEVIAIQEKVVHPFDPVTVTQYVPGALTVCVAPVMPPVHIYVPPPVAVNAILGTLHVKVVLGLAVIPAVGIVPFWNIVIHELEVHPFVPVTVTQYVPGALTVCVAPVMPPVHIYVPPPVAVNVILGTLHVKVVLGLAVIPAVGIVAF